MKKTINDGKTYLHFLRIAASVRSSSTFPSLDLAEERLLDLLASFWISGQKLTVLKAMQMSSDGSTTTVHRRLKSLRLKGMLQLEMDQDDNRIKYIQPTQLSVDLLNELGRMVIQAASAG